MLLTAGKRPIPNISPSTGKRVEEGRLRSFPSVRKEGSLNNFRSSEVILRSSWILIGMWGVLEDMEDADSQNRNPFNDQLIASGSDDGKVAELIGISAFELTNPRYSYGVSPTTFGCTQMQKNPQT